jgi:hypothetical protein
MQKHYKAIRETLKQIELNHRQYSEYKARLSNFSTQCLKEDFLSVVELKNNEYHDNLKKFDMGYKYIPTHSLIKTFLDYNKDELPRELLKEDYYNGIRSQFGNKIITYVNQLDIKPNGLPKLDELRKRCPPTLEISHQQNAENKFEIRVKNSFIVLLEFYNNYTTHYNISVSGLNDYVAHYNPQFRKEYKLPTYFKRRMKEIDRSELKVIRKINNFFVERFALQTPRGTKMSPHVALHSFMVYLWLLFSYG